MDNGSSMYIDYLGMGDAWNIKADEANGLYSFKATDDKILDVMKDVGIEQEDVHECLV